MNILSMQSGGGMPPFTYYQPVAVNNQQPQQVASSSSARSSADATEKGKITDKDLMDMLGKIDGLPNDMSKVYDMMSTFYREQELGISTSSLSTTYLRALQYLKTAKFNKEQFDNAYKTVSKNKGLNEIAINETGHIIARDENNNIKYLTAEDYLNNRDKYLAYTNQDLLQIRAEDPDYAYKNGLFNAVNNGIGLEVVDKLVQQYMIKLGENSMTNEGYVQTKDGKIIQGLEYIQSAAKQAAESGQQFNASGVSIDGLYKTKLLTKEQAAQAINALQYIYSMLPDNAKTLLKVKTGSDKNALNMLAGFVSGQVDSTYEFNVDMVEDASGHKPGSKTKDASSGSGTPMSAAMAAVLGKGAKEEVIFNTGNSNSIKMLGIVGTLGKEGENGGALPAGSSLQDVSASNYKGILDMNNATFGGAKLNNLGLQHTTIKDSDIVFVDMPVDPNAPNGIIRPYLELTQKIEDADNEIRQLGIQDTDFDKINEVYKKHGLADKYVNGQLNQHAYKRFAIIYADVDGRVIDDEEMFNKDLIDIVNDDYSKEQFERIIRAKTNDKKYTMSNSFIGSDDLYRGAVFIPVREDLFNAAMTSGAASQFKIPTQSAIEIDNRQQLKDIQNNTIQRYNRAPSLSTLQ